MTPYMVKSAVDARKSLAEWRIMARKLNDVDEVSLDG